MKNLSRGFTLVELLVSLSIVGVLLGMLLPAVQSVREAARKTHCLNNLRQTGLAVQNFASVHHHFPTAGAQLKSVWGVTEALRQFSSVGESGSWLFQILPFLEQQNTYDLRDEAIAAGHVGFVSAWPVNPDDVNSAMDDVIVSAFVCPSRGLRTVTATDSTPALSWVCGDYAAPCGVWEIGDIPSDRTLPDGTRDPSNFSRGDLNLFPDISFIVMYPKIEDNFWIGIIKASGTVAAVGRSFKYSRVRTSDVDDGLSNTMMAMEKSVDGQMPNIVGRNPTSATGEVLGIYAPNYMTNMRFILSPINGKVLVADDVQDPAVHMRTLTERGGVDRVLFERGFGSPHPGTTSSVWGDGSVRSVDNSISETAFYDICHRDDGHMIDHSEF